MKAIFLCERTDIIFRAYDSRCVCELQTLTDIEEKLYTKADILHNPKLFSDVEFIFSTWGMPTFTEDEIKSCLPGLKCLFYGAGSVQNFVRPFLNCGIKVISAWAANAIPVAEFTVAQIILANKGYFLTNRLYHEKGRRDAANVFGQINGNCGETVGIIGAGMIGRLVIQMLKNYRLNVIVFDPFLSEEKAEELGVEKCDLHDIFERAFVISNHLANNEQTKGMLNYSCFSRMRENAVFINTGRGAQIVEDDLVRVLKVRSDLTALLDVTYPEPPVKDHPFYTLPNCRLTPHIAGSAGNEVIRMGEYMLTEFKNYLMGNESEYEVTHAMLQTMA